MEKKIYKHMQDNSNLLQQIGINYHCSSNDIVFVQEHIMFWGFYSYVHLHRYKKYIYLQYYYWILVGRTYLYMVTNKLVIVVFFNDIDQSEEKKY